MKKFLILSFSIFALACSNKLTEEAETLKKETFKLHDEVMPLTMGLGDLKDSISNKLKLDSTLKSQALEINSKIQKADDDMMVWMEKLGNAEKIENLEERIKSLTELKAEGEKIKTLTNEAKLKAEEFLRK